MGIVKNRSLKILSAVSAAITLAGTTGVGSFATAAYASDPNNPVPPPGYNMSPSFTETFSGTRLNTAVWSPTYAPRNITNTSILWRTFWDNGEQVVYFDPNYLHLGINPFTVSNGQLTITAQPMSTATKGAVQKDLALNGGKYTTNTVLQNVAYTSGAITTQNAFAQQYGYFEVRARWTGGKGLWPAFWLLPEVRAWPPEIDVMEALSAQPNIVHQNLHPISNPNHTSQAVAIPGSGNGQSFHRYGVLWLPSRMDYYIDGVKTASFPTTSEFSQKMYMIVNLAVGGYWGGSPDSTTKFPAHMDITYVRAWKFNSLP